MSKYISCFWGRVARSTLCELVALFGDKISLPRVDTTRRDRIFNQWRTFWLFMGQVLSSTQSCREALKKAQLWHALGNQKKKTISSNTSAYCQARCRIETDYLEQVNDEVCRKAQTQIGEKDLWYGRHVKVVDGSSLSMPDTQENQDCYPQPDGQKEGCGFPVMRWVAVFSLVTGILLESRTGKLRTAERPLWREMWDVYDEGDVVLADCGFSSLADFWLLSQLKVDCVMPPHQSRKAVTIKKLDKDDCLVQWKKGDDPPQWLSEQQWKEIPESLTIRQITIHIDLPGYRTKKITIATTLLDNKQYPAKALAELYRRRWLAEIFFRDIKTTMRMDVLRCKTPYMIRKEVIIFSIAYNLIRTMIWDVTAKKGIDPYRVSVSGTLAAIRQWTPILSALRSQKEKRKIIQILLYTLVSDLIPIRERERQPRALKRRIKNYRLLTKPRHEFREEPKRHKYKKKA